MAEKKPKAEVDALLDQLLEGHAPGSIFDPGGLIHDLTKRLAAVDAVGEGLDRGAQSAHDQVR